MTSSEIPPYFSRTPPPIDDEEEDAGASNEIGGGIKVLDLDSRSPSTSRDVSPVKQTGKNNGNSSNGQEHSESSENGRNFEPSRNHSPSDIIPEDPSVVKDPIRINGFIDHHPDVESLEPPGVPREEQESSQNSAEQLEEELPQSADSSEFPVGDVESTEGNDNAEISSETLGPSGSDFQDPQGSNIHVNHHSEQEEKEEKPKDHGSSFGTDFAVNRSESNSPSLPNEDQAFGDQEEALSFRGQRKDSIEDDFGDFADFGDFSALAEQSTSEDNQENYFDETTEGREPDTGDDQWAAFDAFPETEETEKGVGDDGWASFPGVGTGEAEASVPVEESDEWGDFGSPAVAQEQSAFTFDTSQSTSSATDSASSNQKLKSLQAALQDQSHLSWDSCFCNEGSNASGALGSTTESLWNILPEMSWGSGTEEVGKTETETDEKSLWQNLKRIEETMGLRYQWLDPPAQVYQGFLVSLSMSLQMARMRRVDPNRPVHAAHLGTVKLTPQPQTVVTSSLTRPGTSSGAPRLDILEPTPVAGSLTGGRVVTARLAPDGSSSQAPSPPSTTRNGPPPVPPEAVDSLSAPPADFDWSESGLTNPLRGATASSAIMDLDFLATNELANSESALESDLRALGLEGGQPKQSSSSSAKPAPAAKARQLPTERKTIPKTNSSENSGGYIAAGKGDDILASIMKKQQNSSTADNSKRQILSPSSLSAEAQRLSDSFPSLGFMLSPMLMFPVRGDLEES